MDSSAQQQLKSPTNTVETPCANGDAWAQVDGQWRRECAGCEPGISYNQNTRDGHTELTLEVPFTINLSTPELVQRIRNAWLFSHAMYPEVAVQISTGTEIPQTMKFDPLRSNAEADAWIQETLRIVTDQSARDVVNMTYNRRLTTKGKRSMLYFTAGPASDPQNPTHHCLIWNVSHVLADIYSVVQFFNYFFNVVTHMSSTENLTVDQLDYSTVVGRLPVSPVTPYQAQYNPTGEQTQESINGRHQQSQLLESKMPQSIAMYPESNTDNRSHKTHCIRLQYTLPESRALLAELRREKLSITFAAAAATLLAVKQTYGKGHETGALLGMTRNARRWVDTLGQREHGTSVPHAADVVFLWIPFYPEWFQGSTRDSLFHLGRAIKKELGPHIDSPHYLASLSFTSDRAVEALAAEKEPTAAPCAPGFSPQGALGLKPEHSSASATIKTYDFIHTGRQINASPWVGMFSLWDQVTLSIGFDSKYHDPVTMDVFMALVKTNLASVTLGRTLAGPVSKL